MFSEFEHPEGKKKAGGVICKYTTERMHVDLDVPLGRKKAFLKSEDANAKSESTHRLAWAPPGLISAPWKSRFGSGWCGGMLHAQSVVDSKETTAGVRSGWVWVRASVPLWIYWWHHKPLNQCFTTPGYSLVGFVAVVRFSKKNTK